MFRETGGLVKLEVSGAALGPRSRLPDPTSPDVAALREEIERLRRQLMDRERLASVGLLINDIAHEIYNPLAWVKLNEGVLRMTVEQVKGTQDPKAFLDRLPKLLEILKDNEEGLNRIQYVVDALRLMSRGHAATRSATDLNMVCQRTLVMLNQVFKKKAVEVRTELGATAMVVCDPNEVAQAVMNLLTNGADAVGTNGHIRLRTWTDGTNATIEVDDDGPGVPPDQRAQIFEPFVTTKPLGTGLGLPLVKSVALDHGGRVDVSSSDLGGARFQVILPLVPPAR